MTDWLKDFKSQYPGTVSNNFAKQGRATEYIPVKVHIVGEDDGTGYYKTQLLLDAFCVLNEQYIPVGFHFYIFEEVNYINSTDLYDHGSSFNIGSIISANVDNRAANMFFVEDPAGACGYYSGFRDYIAIKKTCGGTGNSTIAHEFGHFFSLPHTFSGWENRDPFVDPATSSDERVNGSNCGFRGDGFCDTPADFISDRWNCPYTDNKVDANGDLYAPDGTLFMSYSNDNCQERFSPEQIDAMQNQLATQRGNLLQQPDPNVDSIPPVVRVSPIDSVFGVAANQATLRWNSSPNATHYHLQATRLLTNNIFNYDLITTDTFFTFTDMDPRQRYRWRVRPFNAGYTCQNDVSFEFFYTTLLTSNNTTGIIRNTKCAGENNGILEVSVVGGENAYEFLWSTGDSTNLIEDLAPGTYTVTVTGPTPQAGVYDEVIKTYTILDGQLNVNFNGDGTGLTVSASGGLAPYSYEWSDGSTDQTLANGTLGSTYAVTVTDANGCSTIRESFAVGVEQISEELNLSLYPNPVIGSRQLNVNLQSNVQGEAHIAIYHLNGKVIYSKMRELNAGDFKHTIDAKGFAPGTYLLKVQTGENSVVKRIIIL